MVQVIPIDTGRSSTKLINGVSFRSVVGEWHHREISDNEEYEVIIDGEKYFVGQLAIDESIAPVEFNTSSKITNENKVLFLTGVALSAVENDEDTSLFVVTGVPVDMFNVATKTALENLLYGEYNIRVNDKHIKKLCIDSVTIVPEGVAAYQYQLSKDDSLRLGKKRIIDIGSLTVNFSTISDTKFINRDSGTLAFGMIKIRGNQVSNEQYVKRIIAELSQKFSDYDPSDRVLLTGGGALQFSELFRKHYKNLEIIDNPVFANTLGYYRMGVSRCIKENMKVKAE